MFEVCLGTLMLEVGTRKPGPRLSYVTRANAAAIMRLGRGGNNTEIPHLFLCRSGFYSQLYVLGNYYISCRLSFITFNELDTGCC